VTVGRFTVGSQSRAGTNQAPNSDQWIFIRERHKVASWQFAMKGLDAPTTELLFDGGIFSLDYLQHYIEQIMRFKISRHGYALVHAGCVASDGSAILFPGLGHAGKTALALHQVLAGRKFQADDYTFISASGETYCYPRRLHISEHIDAVCPAALTKISPLHKASIKAKSLIYYATLKYGDLSEALQLAEMIPDAQLADVARLRAVLLLTGVDGSELTGPRSVDQSELVDRIMQINGLEAKRFQKVLERARPVGQMAADDEWLNRERDVLEEALKGVPGYEVRVPRQATNPESTMDRLGRVVDTMLELVPDATSR
jgi:hypothetical protein